MCVCMHACMHMPVCACKHVHGYVYICVCERMCVWTERGSVHVRTAQWESCKDGLLDSVIGQVVGVPHPELGLLYWVEVF